MALDFYFDYSCPYAYIASTHIEGVAARCGVPLRLKPVLLGGLLKAQGRPSNATDEMPVAKARHNLLDMHRWAALRGVPLSFHPRHPVRTLLALRVTVAAGEPFGSLMHVFFRAYWVDNRDLDDPEVVRAILAEHALDAAALLERASSAEVKGELRARTDEALAAGVFGVPTMVAAGVLLWGQDRLEQVERLLAPVDPVAVAEPAGAPQYDVDLWFDYSSPYTYLACSRARASFGGRLRWRPMLLGAVFQAVGQAMVPLLAMSEARRDYHVQDLKRQAEEAGVLLNWPSGFPVHTVTALRVTLAVARDPDWSDRLDAVISGFFRAVWVEDRDPKDPEVVSDVVTSAGLVASDVLAAANNPEGKQALFAATSGAVDAGVFGAPTWVVRADSGPALFWGNDRLVTARLAAAGDARVLLAGLEDSGGA